MTIQKVDLKTGETLSPDDVKNYVYDNGMNETDFTTHEKYWKGENEQINTRLSDKEYTDSPVNNIIAVPHARKISKTVVGYAFKPGLIDYTSEDKKYLEIVKEIFTQNGEQEKTAKSGLYMSSRGVSYELMYTRMVNNEIEYRFAFVDPVEVIPLYSYDIESELVCVIRYYTRTINDVDIVYIDVYYDWVIQYFQIANGKIEVRAEEEIHLFKQVPWVIYANNDEYQPDYWAVKDLIDAYDVLMSDSMNEFDRFAYAYLKLVGFALKEEDADRLKRLKIFEMLDSPDAVSYLTKDINTEFISYMTKTIEELIFKYAHVYDPTDENFAGVQSGIALRYKLFDMETNLISFKESYHKKGLEMRLKLLKNILEMKGITTDKPVQIHYDRNEPNNLMELSEIIAKLKGIISDETILSLFPADIIPDVKAELDRLNKQKEESRKLNLDFFQKNDDIDSKERNGEE